MPLDCSDEEFARVVHSAITITGTVRALGRAVVGSNVRLVRREIARLGLDTTHWKGIAHGTSRAPPKVHSANVLIENSPYSRKLAKAIILRERLLTYTCVVCGLGPEWNGRSLVLRLDHKNGRRTDHRLENFRFLCPNCDAQSETYCGRPQPMKIEWPSVDELRRRIEASSCLAVARELGVSNTAITKHLRVRARAVDGARL